MDSFLALPWRHGPAIVLALLGTALAIHGVRGMPNPTRQHVDIMAWLYGFRRMVAGLGVALFGIAWLQQLPWLLVIAIAAGLQEIRESSAYIGTLERDAGRIGAGGH